MSFQQYVHPSVVAYFKTKTVICMDVYLLGAGFSNDAGVPTMKNFMDGVHTAAVAYKSRPEAAVIEAALEIAFSGMLTA
ncbi:MAG: hypothetical protein KGZ63_03185 [Clostridiales bacterium]|jgi:hypothetical protein|nr:hypothetical protein [Clostridiales bacterium]